MIRLVIGLTLSAHGAQKLFGLFGGYGIAGTGGFFDSIGFRPGKAMAVTAGLGETLGGLAFAAGCFTPIAAGVLISTMLVAISVHAPKGFFAQGGGYEYPLILTAAVAALAFTGPGAWSVDAMLGHALDGTLWGVIALALGVVGALPPIAIRATKLPAAQSSAS